MIEPTTAKIILLRKLRIVTVNEKETIFTFERIKDFNDYIENFHIKYVGDDVVFIG